MSTFLPLQWDNFQDNLCFLSKTRHLFNYGYSAPTHFSTPLFSDFLSPVLRNICLSLKISCENSSITQLSGDLYKTDMTETIGCWSNVPLLFLFSYKNWFYLEGQYASLRYEFSSLHYKLMWPLWIMTWRQKLLGRSSENYNSETENW